jgi:hypothetical protein
VPLNKWLAAFYLLCSSTNGMSAHQLHRSIGVTYKTAWLMFHRIREAMKGPAFVSKLGGVVEEGSTSAKARRNGKLRIPLPFEDAIKAGTETTPPEKPKKKRPARKRS